MHKSKRMDYRPLIGALVFLAGLIFLVVAGSSSAQHVVERSPGSEALSAFEVSAGLTA